MSFHKRAEMKAQIFADRRQRIAVHTDNVMMVIFDFDDGPADAPDPMHSHPHEQISYIAHGKVLYLVGDERKTLEAGDMVTIAPNLPHAIQVLTPSARLVDAFTPVREDFLS
jgi:quercetin dioxygenase-like cupin family protein